MGSAQQNNNNTNSPLRHKEHNINNYESLLVKKHSPLRQQNLLLGSDSSISKYTNQQKIYQTAIH